MDPIYFILKPRPPPQSKPAARPGDQEEEGHPPGEEGDVEQRYTEARNRVLDVPVDVVERMHRVEDEDPQDSQHAEPVEVVQPRRARPGASGGLAFILHWNHRHGNMPIFFSGLFKIETRRARMDPRIGDNRDNSCHCIVDSGFAVPIYL